MANNGGSGGIIAICIFLSVIGLMLFAATSDESGRGGTGFVVFPVPK